MSDFTNNPKRELVEDYNAFRKDAMGPERYSKAVAKGRIHDPSAADRTARKRQKTNARERQREREEMRLASVLCDEIVGTPRADIARKFNITVKQVSNLLTEAQRRGFHQVAQDIIKLRLLPKAAQVYEEHLDEGSLEAARDVMRGTGVLPDKPPLVAGDAPAGEITLQMIRMRLAAGQSVRDNVEAIDALVEHVDQTGFDEHITASAGDSEAHAQQKALERAHRSLRDEQPGAELEDDSTS